MAATWEIQDGYPLDINCNCKDTTPDVVINFSDGTVTVDNTEIINKLTEISNKITTQQTVLNNIFGEIDGINDPLTQHILTTASVGTIPANVQSYTIINLGLNPSDPDSSMNSYTLDGVTIYSKVTQFGNSSDSTSVISNAVNYDPNGNTLLIIYNTK